MISWRRLPWTAHDWPSGREGAGGRQNLQPARKTGGGDRLIFEPPDMNRTADARDCGDVTQLLRAWSAGDADAFERVLPLVYEELHHMAARYLVGERSGNSLQPTALINELCLRLLGWDRVTWQKSRALLRGIGRDDAARPRRHRAAAARRATGRARRGSRASRRRRHAYQRTVCGHSRGRFRSPAAGGGGPTQGAGRGASFLRRPLDGRNRGSPRGIAAYGPFRLVVCARVAVPHAHGRPWRLIAFVWSNASLPKRWSS